MEKNIICVGPKGSGKTLLLKKLQDINSVDITSNSIPTVGTNLFTIKNEEKTYTVRELGGTMAPLWHNYLKNVHKIIYVIDASNLCQISAAGVLFYTLLAQPYVQNAKILLVLTKMDLSYRQMRNEALLMLQIKRLQTEIRQSVTIVTTSAINGEGRDDMLDWLKKK